MALEFICAEIIMHGKRIKIPRGADCYRCKSGKIKFFKANQVNGEKVIPRGAEYISFSMERNAFNIGYGSPSFYWSGGNDLKMSNC